MVKNLEGEVWRVHPKWNWMAASNYGRVKSLERDIVYKNGVVHHYEEQLIKLEPSNGYLRFNIKKNTKIVAQPFVHRFVYECFHKVIIPKGMKELQINHLDCNTSNNQIFNLELCTPQRNIDYSVSKQVGQYDLEGNLIRVWKSTAECGRNGFTQQAVSDCCNGKRESHKHFLWKYL